MLANLIIWLYDSYFVLVSHHPCQLVEYFKGIVFFVLEVEPHVVLANHEDRECAPQTKVLEHQRAPSRGVVEGLFVTRRCVKLSIGVVAISKLGTPITPGFTTPGSNGGPHVQQTQILRKVVYDSYLPSPPKSLNITLLLVKQKVLSNNRRV